MRPIGLVCLVLAVPGVSWGAAPDFSRYVAIGDSFTMGVQDGTANELTQPHGYAPLLAGQLGAPFPLPLLPVGAPGRQDFTIASPNLGVGGSTLSDAIRVWADAERPEDIDSLVDLILFPRQGSQLEVAEASGATFITVWIGNNDVLGAVTARRLDASQLTPVDQFGVDYMTLVGHLAATGASLALATLPDPTTFPFALDGADLGALFGTDFGLPAGHLVNFRFVRAVSGGANGVAIVQLPGWVLDSAEVQRIQLHVQALNAAIRRAAEVSGAALVDLCNLFARLQAEPVHTGDAILSTGVGGGIFSLDNVHLSNSGYALVANAFIQAMNDFYGADIPLIDLGSVVAADPYVDNDGDGLVEGRDFIILPGVSGDRDDTDAAVQ